jgi:hypothetical protein
MRNDVRSLEPLVVELGTRVARAAAFPHTVNRMEAL